MQVEDKQKKQSIQINAENQKIQVTDDPYNPRKKSSKKFDIDPEVIVAKKEIIEENKEQPSS